MQKMKKFIRAEIHENGNVIAQAKGLNDIELAIIVAMLLASVKQNKPDMPDQAFDKLLNIVKTGAKLRPEELATVLGTYCNSGVSGIGEMVKDIFSGVKGDN
jgi:hypothetical protein